MSPFTQEAEKLLFRLIDNANVFFLYFDADGNVSVCNKKLEYITGKNREGIIGQNWLNVLYRNSDAAIKQQMFKAVVDDSIKYRRPNSFEAVISDRDNNERFIFWSITPIAAATGELEGILLIGDDITERKKLEYQIFQTEKLAAIGQFVAGMAHEINNPLFVISGRTDMLLEQKRLSSKVRESLNIVSAQTDRIRKLLDRLFKFSRKSQPKLEAININDIIESVLPLLSYHKLPSSAVNIEKDLAEGLFPIKGDLNQLQEVFINLLLNAYQSMPEGGKIAIKTGNFQDRYAEVLISNTGGGIPQQDLKNLFMPFFSKKKDGTGLGLSICYNIIKNHNGSIDVESQVNKGTTFIIKLPFA